MNLNLAKEILRDEIKTLEYKNKVSYAEEMYDALKNLLSNRKDKEAWKKAKELIDKIEKGNGYGEF